MKRLTIVIGLLAMLLGACGPGSGLAGDGTGTTGTSTPAAPTSPPATSVPARPRPETTTSTTGAEPTATRFVDVYFAKDGRCASPVARAVPATPDLASTIDRVEFHQDGKPVTVFSSEGLLLEDPVTRQDHLAALPLAPVLPDTIDLWRHPELPDIGSCAPADSRSVVLVAEDDVLNVRICPGTDNEIIGMLAPGVAVA